MNFQLGDIVRLKSGGEKMTVESISDDLVDCVWMNDKKVERHSFEPVVLEKVTRPAVAVSSTSVPSMKTPWSK
jgi:uncharacterized protein YodC (DUF2158 family)